MASSNKALAIFFCGLPLLKLQQRNAKFINPVDWC